MDNHIETAKNIRGSDENHNGICARARPKGKLPNRPLDREARQSNKKRKPKRVQERGGGNYQRALDAVRKYIHPTENIGISDLAMQIMNDLINHMFEVITTEAMHIIRRDEKVTLSTRSIQTAIRLVFPPEMSKQGIEVCETALEKLRRRETRGTL
ncbi:Histone-fold-containing protein [Hyaloscypha variabilis]